MHTRDDVRHEAASATSSAGRLLDGLGRTTLVAATALAGCVLLVVFGATVSMCWMIHPALSAAAMISLAWIAVRLGGKLFWTSPGSTERRYSR